MIKINLKYCTLAKLDELFCLKEIQEMPALTDWLSCPVDTSDFEHQMLGILQKKLIGHVHDWNETELTIEFIGPLLALVNFCHGSRYEH